MTRNQKSHRGPFARTATVLGVTVFAAVVAMLAAELRHHAHSHDPKPAPAEDSPVVG